MNGLRKIEAGIYETDNGRYRIERGRANKPCGGPHPGCPGDELHESSVWLVREKRGANWMPITFEQHVVERLADGAELVVGRE